MVHMPAPSKRVRSIIIDNYDSYTYNLFQMIGEINGIPPIVVFNDDNEGDFHRTIQNCIQKTMHEYPQYDFKYNIVISPGPGSPVCSSDFGMCVEAIKSSCEIPVLGVCLGFQGLGIHYGLELVQSKHAMHGVISRIEVLKYDPLFACVPDKFNVVRYHSLELKWNHHAKSKIVVIAQTDDFENTLMAIRHRELLKWGVQFHPESICSEFGYQILQNFRDITLKQPCTKTSIQHKLNVPRSLIDCNLCNKDVLSSVLLVYKLNNLELDPKMVYSALYSKLDYAFWLDSSLTSETSRYSIMGSINGPRGFLLEYNVVEHCTRKYVFEKKNKKYSVETSSSADILTIIQEYLNKIGPGIQIERMYSNEKYEIPFEFRGGFVGYLGYESYLKDFYHSENTIKQKIIDQASKGENIPTSSFLFVDQFIVFDRLENNVYIVALNDGNEFGYSANVSWVKHVTNKIMELQGVVGGCEAEPRVTDKVIFHPSKSKEEYINDIKEALRLINMGETYEVCLTNQLHAPYQIKNSFNFYCTLRELNQAPFAAYFNFNFNKYDDSIGSFAICCSSPESFVRMKSNGEIESRPIKGTRKRGACEKEDLEMVKELQSCVKERAENLMITDLVRNDLGRVCRFGSVHVPNLMNVESYATVHQLVSTIRGQKADHIYSTDVLRALFPGGSMTGAPKLRTMHFIRSLENKPRGIYSGALGYLSIDGAMDFNIVIRTAIIQENGISIGSGGAIVAFSNAEAEYDEMLLKVKVLLRAIGKYCTDNEQNCEVRESRINDISENVP